MTSNAFQSHEARGWCGVSKRPTAQWRSGEQHGLWTTIDNDLWLTYSVGLGAWHRFQWNVSADTAASRRSTRLLGLYTCRIVVRVMISAWPQYRTPIIIIGLFTLSSARRPLGGASMVRGQTRRWRANSQSDEQQGSCCSDWELH